MQIRAAITSLALVASVPALAHPDLPVPTVTPAPLIAHTELDDDQASECMRMVSTILMPPEPTGSLASWLSTAVPQDALFQSAVAAASEVDVDQACSLWLSTPTPPASLTSALSSYNSQYANWSASIAPVLSSVGAQCTGDGGLEGLIGVAVELVAATDAAQCTDAWEHYNRVASSTDLSASVAKPKYVGVMAGVAGLAAAIVLF